MSFPHHCGVKDHKQLETAKEEQRIWFAPMAHSIFSGPGQKVVFTLTLGRRLGLQIFKLGDM
jgi:hypothetical protein